MLVFMVMAVACGQGGDDPTVPSVSATTPTPTPLVSVPKVKGSSRDEAMATLESEGLAARSTTKPSHAKAGTVLSQDPEQGSSVEVGSLVQFVVAKQYPRIPRVVRKLRFTAQRRLQKAGYEVKVVQVRTTISPDGRVLAQIPKGGTEALPGRVVTLRVANNPCTLGYSPCILLGPDVDCIGGSGDGPRYTGYHTVSGYDPYGLDYDNDGRGCE